MQCTFLKFIKVNNDTESVFSCPQQLNPCAHAPICTFKPDLIWDQKWKFMDPALDDWNMDSSSINNFRYRED